jgi:hypothetical protein
MRFNIEDYLAAPQGFENWEACIIKQLHAAGSVKNGLCSHLKPLIAGVNAGVMPTQKRLP